MTERRNEHMAETLLESGARQTTYEAPVQDQAIASIRKFSKIESSAKDSSTYTPFTHQHLPRPSKRRQSESLAERPFDLDSPPNTPLHELGGGPNAPKTVFYLAYGSNLCRETFQGKRGIKPLSAVNVVVPELVMTFDLAGIPYAEPCFANTRYRHPSPTTTFSTATALAPVDEKSPEDSLKGTLPPQSEKKQYHKNNWHKGLVGVVYEVTLSDYAHIIATEGGGASYHDILVDCYELAPGVSTVPDTPTAPAFKAHTLYSPAAAPGTDPPRRGQRASRLDPAYAQASARYLKLITDGADEHDIPQEYKTYLGQIRPYTMTSLRQRAGGLIFRGLWLPVIFAVFGLNRVFADEKGRAPAWLTAITGRIFRAVWVSYDGFFKRVFGDGERTIGE